VDGACSGNPPGYRNSRSVSQRFHVASNIVLWQHQTTISSNYALTGRREYSAANDTYIGSNRFQGVHTWTVIRLNTLRLRDRYVRISGEGDQSSRPPAPKATAMRAATRPFAPGARIRPTRLKQSTGVKQNEATRLPAAPTQ